MKNKTKQKESKIETIIINNYEHKIMRTDNKDREYLRITYKAHGIIKNQFAWCVQLSKTAYLKLDKYGDEVSEVIMLLGDDLVKTRKAYMDFVYATLQIDKQNEAK